MSDAPIHPPLGVILLAAGPSTRLGEPKQLVEVDGESLVCRSARLALSLQPESVTVVTGCEAERVESQLEGLSVRTVLNQRWANGMGGSINCGVRSMPLWPRGVLVMVCDQWRLTETDLARLYTAWSSDISKISVASWKEGNAFISGPPAIFPGTLIPELKSMQEKRGARQLIDRFMDIVEFVDMENAAFDLDRPEDLERVRARVSRCPSS